MRKNGIKKICLNCKEEFISFGHFKKYQPKYCSRLCCARGKWKNPTKKMIEHSKYAQKIMAKKRIGLKHSKESKEKISRSRRGKGAKEANGRWNGGIGSYRKYVDIISCGRCNSTSSLLVHHKDQDRHNNKIFNLEVLCYKCHSKEHNHFERWKNHQKAETFKCKCGRPSKAKGLCSKCYLIKWLKENKKI